MSQNPRIEIVPDAGGLVQTAAVHLVRSAAQAVRASGRFVVALAGGSTPKGLFELLAADPMASQIRWSRVHVGWGDERCVPPDDPASNYRMARESLLDRVPIPPENVHRIHGEQEPGAAAEAYQDELRRLFQTPTGPPRQAEGARFDLVLLGLGEDGHTASLFPGGAALGEERRWAVAEKVGPEAAAGSGWRVTLTPAVINSADEVIFLVSGRAKAAALRRVLEGPYRPDDLPAQAIAPRAGGPHWLVDEEAAAELSRR